jgi:hypothetical protein
MALPRKFPARSFKVNEQAALELGHITMNWGSLEGVLGELMAFLTPLESGSITHVYDGNTDFREKLLILKGLAFIRHFDADWLSDVIYLIDHIENDLRPRRNRVVHAVWFLPSGRLLRRTRKTKLFRPISNTLGPASCRSFGT